jgi:hypothetical protein
VVVVVTLFKTVILTKQMAFLSVINDFLMKLGFFLGHFTDCLWDMTLCGLAVEFPLSSEMLVPVYQPAWCYVSEEHKLKL